MEEASTCTWKGCLVSGIAKIVSSLILSLMLLNSFWCSVVQTNLVSVQVRSKIGLQSTCKFLMYML